MKAKQISIVIFILGCMVFLFTACNHRSRSFTEHILSADKEINALSDSSFFNQITCMNARADLIYVADQKRGEIFCLDTALVLQNTIGGKGNGPGELNQLISFVVTDDTIYAGDAAKQRTLRYTTSGRYVDEIPTGICTPSLMRFAVSGNELCVGMGNPDHMTSMVACDLETQEQRRFGDYVDYGSFAKNMIQNSYSVFIDNDTLIAVPAYEPRIEKYVLPDLKQVQTISLLTIEPVSNLFKSVQTLMAKGQGGFKIVRDAYWQENLLYVLYPELNAEGKVVGSYMLVYDLAQSVQPCVGQYRFGDDDIFKFCVTEDYIYGFVPKASAIKRYPLPK